MAIGFKSLVQIKLLNIECAPFLEIYVYLR